MIRILVDSAADFSKKEIEEKESGYDRCQQSEGTRCRI